MKSIKEGDGSLLDNSMIVYGAGISDGNRHNHDNLPLILAGRGGGTITTGRHIALDSKPDGSEPEYRLQGSANPALSSSPLSNLYVSMLNRMGVKTDRFGDSTGKCEAIA
jgi:hypothetical protein